MESSFGHASRFGIVIAMWLIATGMPNIAQSRPGNESWRFKNRT
jgi:hypothetical protein